MNTGVAAKLAIELMELHGLRPAWNFVWDQAKRRAGCCRYRSKEIGLTLVYVKLNPEREVRDTILHEIAHALVGPGHSHGPVWKAMCIRVGARPIRCYSTEVVMPKGKYRATCGGCEKPFYKHTQPRLKPGRYHYCLGCGPEKGKLRYVCAPPPLPKPEPIDTTPLFDDPTPDTSPLFGD